MQVGIVGEMKHLQNERKVTQLLTIDEIRQFLDEDEGSQLKQAAKVGQRYYDGEHDILDYRMFYYNAEGELVEDEYRANMKLPHMFFAELVDQGTEYVMSAAEEYIFRSDDTGLQEQLDIYFNKNEKFLSEFADTLTGIQVKGFDYMYAYKGKDGRLQFENADCLGVVEVEGRFAEDKKDQRIYKYMDRVDKDGNFQWKILVIDDENTYYYAQTNDGKIETDETVELNPRPHAIYQKDGKLFTKKDAKHFLPFFRFDFNKKRTSLLKPVKPQIDDYDLMNSSLTNNLQDFDTPIHVVRGFEGDNLNELTTNLKTKKLVGVDEDGGLDIMTVDVPYQARKEKMEIDEKNIYKFGMGINTAGLKDSNATTNLAIMQAYALLDLRAKKIVRQAKLFLQSILEPVLAEINEHEGTAYQMEQIWFNFKPKVMSNELEIAQKALADAQRKQIEINNALALQAHLGNELVVKNICEIMDIDYEQVKGQLPDPDEANTSLTGAEGGLESIVPVEE